MPVPHEPDKVCASCSFLKETAISQMLKDRLSSASTSFLAKHGCFGGGSMIAHYTHGNVLAVQKALGYKSIRNTMKYIHMLNLKEDDEFEVATATTVEEVKELIEAGFEKVDEIQGTHIFRRPKRFKV